LWREDEREAIPFCKAEGLGLLPYSPMARGFLSGKNRRTGKPTERSRTDEYADKWYGRPEDARVADVVDEVAAQHGVAPATIAVAWVLAKVPTAAPLFGPTQLRHFEDIVAALKIRLTQADIARIDNGYLYRPPTAHA